MKRVRVIVEIKKWVDGDGYLYTQTYLDEETDVLDLESCDFGFWEPEKLSEGEDLEVIVSYYELDDEELENPLSTFSKWNSEF